jgi:hypothetical protein
VTLLPPPLPLSPPLGRDAHGESEKQIALNLNTIGKTIRNSTIGTMLLYSYTVSYSEIIGVLNG